MRIIVIKKIHEVQSACAGSGIDTLGLMDGESYRIEARALDVKPFGFEGFVSFDVPEAVWNSVQVGRIYGLDIFPNAEPFRDHPSLKG